MDRQKPRLAVDDDAGVLHADAYLAVLPGLLRDSEPQVVGAALDGLEEIREPLITPDVEKDYARYIRDNGVKALEALFARSFAKK